MPKAVKCPSIWTVHPQQPLESSAPKTIAKMSPDKKRSIKRLKMFQNLLYIMVVVILVVGLIAQIIQCLGKYFEKPTYTETQVVKQQEAEFPAFTFCGEGRSYKDEVLQVWCNCTIRNV